MVISSLLSSGTSSSSVVVQVEFLILSLILTLLVALLARRVPYTLLLAIVGLGFGLLPFVPNVYVDPNLIWWWLT